MTDHGCTVVLHTWVFSADRCISKTGCRTLFWSFGAQVYKVQAQSTCSCAPVLPSALAPAGQPGAHAWSSGVRSSRSASLPVLLLQGSCWWV